MAKIKIECEIEFEESFWYADAEELEWFKSVLNDKKDIIIALHSNDVGTTIGQTNDFKWELVDSNKQNWCHYSGMPSPNAYDKNE